jgi:hypothetical protein
MGVFSRQHTADTPQVMTRESARSSGAHWCFNDPNVQV